jgi:acylaminoacyl-peptidase
VRELAADLDRDVVNPTWSRDGRRIYFAYDDQGTTRVAETDLTGRVSNLVDDLGGEVWSRPLRRRLILRREGRHDRLQRERRARPGRGRVYDGGKSRRLTDSTRTCSRSVKLGQVEEIWSTTPVDGRRVQSWLIRPPGFDPAKKVSADPRDPRRAVRELRAAVRRRAAALRGSRATTCCSRIRAAARATARNSAT